MKSTFQYHLSGTEYDIIKEKRRQFIMGELIGFLVVMYLCIYLPWRANERKESRKRQDMYNNLNKKSVDEMEKWRK